MLVVPLLETLAESASRERICPGFLGGQIPSVVLKNNKWVSDNNIPFTLLLG